MILADTDVLAVTLLIAALAYAGLVLVLRVSGKRTLAKWNAFDLIVTVALGSSLATVILSRSTAAAQGLAAVAALVALQFVVTWLSVRFRAIERLVKSEPALLAHRGRLDERAMKRERVTAAEVRAAVRSQGIARMEDVGAVVLETDGSISVIADIEAGPSSALADVKGLDRGEQTP